MWGSTILRLGTKQPSLIKAWAQSAAGLTPEVPGVDLLADTKHPFLGVVVSDIAANRAVRLTVCPATIRVVKLRQLSWGAAKKLANGLT